MLRAYKKHLRILGCSGLLSFIQAKVTKQTRRFSVDRTDCGHRFSLRIPSSDVFTYKQVFIDLEYDFHVANNPKVIIDAGANVGLASIYFANKYPEAKIIAIEPEQSNFDLLKNNVLPYPNVVPLHAALWHKNEEINLVDPGLGHWGFITGEEGDQGILPGETRHTVSGMTLNQIMRDFGLETIDILKVDIEGAEKEVFSDSIAWIDRVNSLIVELHERMKKGCNRSFYMGTNGFDQEWIQGENVYLSRGEFLTKKIN